ncbi:bifunctional 2',3'-cyclic-nucleotide 2'-phosphodiesterase/3'-nucleotidase [Paenibacillus wenxiniae]|uniref:Bifunctional 2',3'-cyclic-nucleotide 2'-phosphodiesterase/3'-nucleotidase n=1 Tax=Paenibacillus wenxiniae TaxID=1636843 RepID=A0ABW4RRP8_9BACL
MKATSSIYRCVYRSAEYRSGSEATTTANEPEQHFSLRLMATTDLHVSLTGYDYYRDHNTNHMGLSRTAALIEQARSEVTNHMLFDNGDILQGNPLGDYAAEQRYWQKEQMGAGVHPLIQLMNKLDYDAATLGNHEFNYGLDYLEQCITGADFPYTNANVYEVKGKQRRPLLSPYILLHRKLYAEDGAEAELCVGVVGVVPPQIMNWDRKHLEGKVEAMEMVEAAKEAIAAARQAGAELIVLLAHCGYAEEDTPTISENAVLPLSRLDGVNALFFGHAHKLFPSEEFAGRPGVNLEQGTIHDVPAAEPGVWGSHLGLIDLELQLTAGRWSVVAGRGRVRPIVDPVSNRALVEPIPELEQAAADAHNRTLQYIHTPVGQLDVPLHSYFSLVTDTAVVQLINEAQRHAGLRLLEQTPYSSLPLLSAAAPFKTGGRYGPLHYTAIAPGGLTLQHMSDIYSYANTFCIVRLYGHEVREWLEWSAGLYNTLSPDDEQQMLLDPAFSPFNFDVIDGLSYRMNVGVPPRYSAEGELIHADSHRIIELTYNGEPVTAAMEFAVATNQYRAFSTPLANPDGQRVIVDAAIENREVLIEYVRQQGHIQPVADHNWSLCYDPKFIGTTGIDTDRTDERAVHCTHLPDSASRPGTESGQSGAKTTQSGVETVQKVEGSVAQQHVYSAVERYPAPTSMTIHALFQSSPDAQIWLDEHPQFSFVQLDTDGFATYRIRIQA